MNANEDIFATKKRSSEMKRVMIISIAYEVNSVHKNVLREKLVHVLERSRTTGLSIGG